eukprot:NODE_2718_length_1509_cov_38.559163_g2342_i0.p1 GENE.NODE_2718_length_1509_cov_38.559163_g2342_i0~~NODE_2718_length_1509_cov_38.559163_g2342_i0.p1  ORF type:complete len:474 (+),score=116.52 NODE_2718_length_1509_cov_38.559163_g2342_i0:81-1424(+)
MYEVTQIYCSPLLRAVETALSIIRIVGNVPGGKIIIDPILADSEGINEDPRLALKENLSDEEYQFLDLESQWREVVVKNTLERVEQIEQLLRLQLQLRSILVVGHTRLWEPLIPRLMPSNNTSNELISMGCGMLLLSYLIDTNTFDRKTMNYPLPSNDDMGSSFSMAAAYTIMYDDDESDEEDIDTTQEIEEEVVLTPVSPLHLPPVIPNEGRAYFIRHGQSRNNALGPWNSWRWVRDPLLTKKGLQQAHDLGRMLTASDFLSTQQINVVYSSPLRRAIQTACTALNDTKVKVVLFPFITEVRKSIGDVGHSFDELEEEPSIENLLPRLDFETHRPFKSQWWPGIVPPRFAESATSRRSRIETFYKWLKTELQIHNIVLVGHSIFWREFLQICLGEHTSIVGNCHMYSLSYNRTTNTFGKAESIVAGEEFEDLEDEDLSSPLRPLHT